MPNAYIFGRLRRTKITRKASDAAEYVELFGSFTRDRHARRHISADVQRITLNASCMTILGERTEQLDIFCHVTGFTSNFLSFIDVELIRFFHGALHIYMAGCRQVMLSSQQLSIAMSTLVTCSSRPTWRCVSVTSVSLWRSLRRVWRRPMTNIRHWLT